MSEYPSQFPKSPFDVKKPTICYFKWLKEREKQKTVTSEKPQLDVSLHKWLTMLTKYAYHIQMWKTDDEKKQFLYNGTVKCKTTP